MKRIVALWLASTLVWPGCGAATDPPPDEADSDSEVDYGVGAKADEGGCHAEADLCWQSNDIRAVRRILVAWSDLALGQADAQALLKNVLDDLDGLSGKLTEEERQAAKELRAEFESLVPGADVTALAKSIQARLLARLVGTYYAAELVQVGKVAEQGFTPSEDASKGDGDEEAVSSKPRSEGVIESLRLLRDAGLLGRAYAKMLEVSGVLEIDYEVVNAQTFGEYDPTHHRIIPRGISREERLARIKKHYERAAGFLGIVAGAEGLIPVAGIAISIAHETFQLFQLHARMAFEIAAVYGWDISEGRNLFNVTMLMLGEGLLAETLDVFVSNAIIPILAKKLATALGFRLPGEIAAQLAKRSLSQLLRIFTQKGEQKLAQAAVTEGAKGVGKQVLGWATVGVAVLASGAIDYLITARLAHHLEVVARRWFQDLMLEGTTYLAPPQARDCLFLSLAAEIAADERVDTREILLFQAFLAKAFREDGQSWFFLDKNERVRHAATLKRVMTDPNAVAEAATCMKAQFEKSLPEHRMSMLGHLYAMMQVDLQESAKERARYDEWRTLLTGKGWFDGAEINEIQLEYVERVVRLSIRPKDLTTLPEEYKKDIAALLPEQILDFLAMPNPAVVTDFRCGFEGLCM